LPERQAQRGQQVFLWLALPRQVPAAVLLALVRESLPAPETEVARTEA
jgi:hypothetical protein